LKITMIGTGYVGLVTGTCFAEVGNDVVCLDVDPRKIEILNAGGVPIHEPGLQAMIARNVAAGRLRFTTDVDAAVAHGALQVIAVGTPPKDNGETDLQYIEAVAMETSDIVGRPLREIEFPRDAIVGALVRGSEVVIPNGSTVIEPGDRVMIFALKPAVPQVEKMMTVKLEYW